MILKRQTQISVITDNRPGTLSRITRALGERGISILGLAAWGETDHGVVRMVVDQPMQALHLLGEHGMIATESKILAIQLPPEPGTLSKVAALLGRKGVNVDYAYGSDAYGPLAGGDESEGAGGVLMIKVDDLPGAERAIKGSALFRRAAKKKTSRRK